MPHPQRAGSKPEAQRGGLTARAHTARSGEAGPGARVPGPQFSLSQAPVPSRVCTCVRLCVCVCAPVCKGACVCVCTLVWCSRWPREHVEGAPWSRGVWPLCAGSFPSQGALGACSQQGAGGQPRH